VRANTTTPVVGSSTVAGFAHLITVKLTTKENYPLWRAQFLPYLRSNNLFGIVDGTPEYITTTTINGAVKEINPEYLTWYSQDQAILGALLTLLSERPRLSCSVQNLSQGMKHSGHKLLRGITSKIYEHQSAARCPE
jgi:hypothetical protein